MSTLKYTKQHTKYIRMVNMPKTNLFETENPKKCFKP